MQSAVSLVQAEYSEVVKRCLARKPALFIGNEWVESSGDATLPVVDPSTGREIARIAEATADDIDRAVAAARNAFDDGRWSNMPAARREALIHRLASALEANAAEFAELEAVDNGKPRNMAAAVDVPAAVQTLRYMAGWPTKLAGEAQSFAEAPPSAFHAYTRREPVGVVAQIVPWNFPLLMLVNKIAPALAAGCTMVMKPAELTSLTALRFADLVQEVGIPAGVINIVTGTGAAAGDMLVRHPGIDKVSFTGSTQIGKQINRTATETLKRVTLELGGKSPVIILPDADLGSAIQAASGAIFFNSGQACIAGSRLFAHSSVFDQVLEGLAGSTHFWVPRPSLDPQAQMGPLVSQQQMDRVMRYIADGRDAGATVAIGGDSPGGDGYYVNPTVLVDVKPDMRVVQEEIFGPVLVAQRFDDLGDVIKAANDTPFGLAASVWTNDLGTMHRLIAEIRSGTVWGNCHAVMGPGLPFGGFKQSGTGREMGREGIEAYTETKTAIIKLAAGMPHH